MSSGYSSNALLINMGELSEQGDSLYKYANKELRETIDKMAKLKNDCNWEGQGFDAFFQSLDKRINVMYQMCNKLSKYGEFLEIASGHFVETKDEVKKDFDNNKQEISLNIDVGEEEKI